MPVAILAVAVVLTAASAYQKSQANKAQQGLNSSIARHNAALDEVGATQEQMDVTENIRRQRAEDAIYTSRQQAAYATSGVLDSGSPLLVETTTVGRMEQNIQQQYINSQKKQDTMRAQGAAGILYANDANDALAAQNTASNLEAGASILSTVYGGYNSGMFSGAKAPSLGASEDSLSKGMRSGSGPV